MKHIDSLGPLPAYSAVSERCAGQIIRAYSTSFGLATKLLGIRHRQHIQNIYALVRVADELVDGVAAEAGLSLDMQMDSLDKLEAETEFAMKTGYSSNPIVHSFGMTARCAGIETELTRSFFASMRMDLELLAATDKPSAGLPAEPIRYNKADHAEYVNGSAETVGLMCLRVFMREEDVTSDVNARLEQGARSLGAAFQNVNFLRDLAEDTFRLGRDYLGEGNTLDTLHHKKWIQEIRDQLKIATETLPLLPGDARLGVSCALKLFTGLTDRLEQTPTHVLYERRVRLPTFSKLRIVAGMLLESRLSRGV